MMAIWRAPVVGLMPDFVQPEDRSKGNAIVNILGGIGSAIVSLVGGALININELERFFVCRNLYACCFCHSLFGRA